MTDLHTSSDDRLQTRIARWLRTDGLFWLAFGVLNALLFLPLYLLNRGAGLAPADAGETLTGVDLLRRLFVWREGYDVFRLSLELTLLTALAVFASRARGRIYRLFFLLLYLLALVYYVYEAATLAIYNVEPVFYSQVQLYGKGLPFLLRHLHLPLLLYLSVGIGLILAVVALAYVVWTLLDDRRLAELNPWSRWGMGVMAALLLLSVAFSGANLANSHRVVSSLIAKVAENASASVELRASASSIDDLAIRVAYDYRGRTLVERPNIYLIFVESYGSVLYKRPDYRILYTQLLGELEDELAADGWGAATALSSSPTWGGGSWFAYTSTLFGLRIDNQPEYLTLLAQYQQAEYPDLGRYLKSQGYDYDWLTSITTELSEEKWLRYQRFYGADHWYRHRDLHYEGPEYSWGPAPPDQYALNYVRESIRQRTDDPFLLFFITQMSHYPWTNLPPIVDDWRTLNRLQAQMGEVVDPDAMSHDVRRRNYMRAIDYELRFLVDAIRSEDENAIFVLIGDHQPPRVSRRNDGWETPVHVISRDPRLLEQFVSAGFTPGLVVDDLEPDLKHEGFYSLFMRALLARYGERNATLPAYLPDGVLQPAPVAQH